ncbi:MAG: galactose-1-phosphate uridylyltransferase [Candidatus Brocadiia bacterium]
MSEFRRDRVSGRWVIIAPERAARPTDFPVERRYSVGGFCPFCEGHEDKTPPEVAVLRSDPQQANRPGWRVRVVTNRFPALRPDAPIEVVGDAACRGMTGFGVHEVIIESPRHILSLNEMDDAGVADVLRIYQQRLASVRQDSRFLYGMIFKNVGSAAGATVEHSHSQMIGMPVVPETVRTEVRHARQFNEAAGVCLFCNMIDREVAKGERVIHVGRHCIAIAPYASRFPFETWILPTRHVPHFEDHPAEALGDIASALRTVLNRLDQALETPAYNYLIHTSPLGEKSADYFHWHIEIIPCITKIAGFEWGTGCYINPVLPESAAAFLREASKLGRSASGGRVAASS